MDNSVINMLLELIPRYITDRVALVDTDNGLQVYCLESQVMEEEKYIIKYYGTIRTFTWLGRTTGGTVVIDD